MLSIRISEDYLERCICSVCFKLYFFDIQTSKELIQMEINKKMRNGIFTMNGEHTQSEN